MALYLGTQKVAPIRNIGTPGDGVTDVKVDGTSVVTNHVANIDLTSKQEVLTAGANITIARDPDTKELVISATGGGAEYTAGAGIDINDNEISVLTGDYITFDMDNNVTVDIESVQDQLSEVFLDKTDTEEILYGTDENGNQKTYDETNYVHKNNPDDTPEILDTKQIGSSSGDFLILDNDRMTFHNMQSRFAEYTRTSVNTSGGYFNFPTGKTTNETFAMMSDISGKQNTLTPGTGIDITNNTITAVGVKETHNNSLLKFYKCTQAEYDALTSKDSSTMYVIIG